jgi:hypothetical protein
VDRVLPLTTADSTGLAGFVYNAVVATHKGMRLMQSFDLILRNRKIRTDDSGRICLNDIWAAGNFLPNQKSQDWWRNLATKRLVKALIARLPGLARQSEQDQIAALYNAKPGTNGGTFAHPILACAYAGYLSPDLEIEIREIWLRYNAGDATLADDILSRASASANLWAATRAEARAIRNDYTSMLRDHDVTGRGYMECTDETYLRLFDGPAWRLRQQRGLPKGINVRDSMSTVELSAIKLTEALASERIEEEDHRGNQACKEATGRTASNVRLAIDLERKDRQKRLV